MIAGIKFIMVFIEWTDSMEIGVPELDAHHKRLVDLTNRFYDAINEGNADIALNTILPELLNYAMYHFLKEEEIMDKYSYPMATRHKKEHSLLMSRTIALYDMYTNGDNSVIEAIFIFMKEWIINHILKTDKMIYYFFKEKGIV